MSNGPFLGTVRMMQDGLDIEIHALGSRAQLTIRGEIDMGNAPRLTACLMGLIDVGARNIEVDLAHVEFIDSSGVNALAAADERLESGRLVLTGCGPDIRRVLEVAGLRNCS